MPPQVVVEGTVDFLFIEIEEHVNAGRLDVGVDDADAAALAGQEGGQVGGEVGLAGAAAVRMDGENAGHDNIPGGVGSAPPSAVLRRALPEILRFFPQLLKIVRAGHLGDLAVLACLVNLDLELIHLGLQALDAELHFMAHALEDACQPAQLIGALSNLFELGRVEMSLLNRAGCRGDGGYLPEVFVFLVAQAFLFQAGADAARSSTGSNGLGRKSSAPNSMQRTTL